MFQPEGIVDNSSTRVSHQRHKPAAAIPNVSDIAVLKTAVYCEEDSAHWDIGLIELLDEVFNMQKRSGSGGKVI